MSACSKDLADRLVATSNSSPAAILVAIKQSARDLVRLVLALHGYASGAELPQSCDALRVVKLLELFQFVFKILEDVLDALLAFHPNVLFFIHILDRDLLPTVKLFVVSYL